MRLTPTHKPRKLTRKSEAGSFTDLVAALALTLTKALSEAPSGAMIPEQERHRRTRSRFPITSR